MLLHDVLLLMALKNSSTSVYSFGVACGNVISDKDKTEDSFDIINFIFALKVFTELGIIKISGKMLVVNDVKTKLTDSRIYNKVIELKKS